jgi:hypothetical protein
MKKLLLCMFLALVSTETFAVADAGSAIISTDAGSGSAVAPPDTGSGSAVATPPATGSEAASQLHDPT